MVKGYVTARPDRCTCDAHYRAQVSGPCQYPDTTSSASRQHYIDTGRYLTHGETQEN